MLFRGYKDKFFYCAKCLNIIFFIEVASKIARILGVSLDYLVGNTDMELDKTVIDWVIEIQSLPEEDKNPILYTLDNLFQNARTKKAFAAK